MSITSETEAERQRATAAIDSDVSTPGGPVTTSMIAALQAEFSLTQMLDRCLGAQELPPRGVRLSLGCWRDPQGLQGLGGSSRRRPGDRA
jgi:hypothetical protein